MGKDMIKDKNDRGRVMSLLQFFILHFSLFILLGCTIFDNDLREHSDIPGYDEVVHEETDEYTLDYQFLETTRVLTERDLSYVAGIDYGKETLYFNGSTPDDVLPKVGQVLHHGVCDELPYGLNHKPTAIVREGDLYAVTMERAALDEVFKTLKLEGEFVWGADSIAEDSLTEEGDGAESRARALRKDKSAPIVTEENFSGEWNTINLVSFLPTVKGNISTKYISGFASLQGLFNIRWRPILKQKVYLDMDNHKIDAKTSVGVEWELDPDVTGSLNIKVNLLGVVGLADKLKGVKPIVPQLALFLHYALKLDASITFSGSFKGKQKQATYVDIGGRHGMKLKDGLYLTPCNQKSKPDWMQKALDGKASFDLELLGGGEVKLLFGSPTEYPNIGISLALLVGPSLRTIIPQKDLSLELLYDALLRFAFRFKVDGKLFLNIWKGITLDWSYTDFIAKQFGKSEGAKFDIPGTIFDTRFYPYFERTSIYCENLKETGTPIFNVAFDVTDEGLASILFFQRPVLRVWPHGSHSGSPLLETTLDRLESDREDHYTWRIKNSKIKRDEVYDLEIMIERRAISFDDVSNPWKPACTKFYTFSTKSPSIFIERDVITAQTERRALRPVNKNGKDFYYCYYDYKFRTGVEVNGRDGIDSWGFKIGEKTYFEEKGKPGSHVLVAGWNVKDSQKRERNIPITPFLTYRLEGEQITSLMPTYTVKLSYNSSLNTYHNQTIGKYVYSGFDHDDEYEKVDIDMSDKKLAPRRNTWDTTTTYNVFEAEADDDLSDLDISVTVLE